MLGDDLFQDPVVRFNDGVRFVIAQMLSQTCRSFDVGEHEREDPSRQPCHAISVGSLIRLGKGAVTIGRAEMFGPAVDRLGSDGLRDWPSRVTGTTDRTC
jgi:hypothetical protein